MLNNTVISFVLGLLVAVSCSEKQETTIPISENTQEAIAVPKMKPEEEGKSLIEQADCLTCHKAEGRLIGPSYQEISEKYTAADADQLADKIVNGGSGVWGEVPMAAHPGLDKENAKKMVTYILSLKK